MRWKFFVLVLVVLSIFANTQYVNAASCGVSDDNQLIMRLYYNNNSHGALWNQTAYTYTICYNNIFGSVYTGATPHACTGAGPIPDNKVLGLYSVNNSHAEIPSSDSYPIDVCYGNLVCRAISADCAADEKAIVRLYQDSNSHISNASTSAYSIRICCKAGATVGTTLTNAFWASMNDSTEIFQADLNDRVRLMVAGTGLAGKTIDFTIFKEVAWWFDTKVAEDSSTEYTTWVANAEGTYYFTASIAGVGSVTSGDLVVSAEDNTPPVTEILSPGICEIYFTGENIGFTQTSSDVDDNIAFYWDFGDDFTSTLPNPTHIYTTGGQKTIILTVRDERGSTATDRTTILVVDKSKTLPEKYICAYINEPEWGENVYGFDIFFNATDTYAIEATCNAGSCSSISCIAGLCKLQTFSGMLVSGTIPNWPGFENINFSWVFDDGFIYKENGMLGAWFTKTFSYTGSHWAKLTASINPEGSTETQFSNYAYSACRIESGEWIWWDYNGIPQDPLTYGGACRDTDGTLTLPNCCPPGYACEIPADAPEQTEEYALCQLSSDDYCANIVVCDDYLTQLTCEDDICGRGDLQPGSNPGGNILVDDECGSPSFTFGNGSCKWDAARGCIHVQGLKSTIYQGIPFTYRCEDETDHGECIDGLMNIIKKGALILVSGGSIPPEVIEECKIKLCPDYEGVIMCGSPLVKLVFFGLRNLITAVLVIAIIYIVLIYRKKAKKNKKRESKKTARKKKI